MDMQQLNDIFGPQAAHFQAIINQITAPMQDQIQQLQAQLNAIPPPPPPPAVNPNDIANAVANAIAQAIPAPNPPHPREPHVADPQPFSGDRTQSDSFIRSVRTVFHLQPSRFPAGDEGRRILFALGHMKQGHAAVWANNIATAMLDPETDNPYATFDDFQDAFEKAFGNADKAQKARTELAKLSMKPGDSVEEYTTQFETYAKLTGYNDEALIEIYSNGLLQRMVDKIYSNPEGTLPPTLEAWKTKARQLDNLYQQYLVKKSQARSPNTQTKAPNPPSVRAPATTTSPPAPKQSDAMEVDGGRRSVRKTVRCYNCNEFGHIARDCTKPKREYRSVRATEIAEVVRAVLKETHAPAEAEKAEEPAKGTDFQDAQQ